MRACLVQMAETSASPACSFFDPPWHPLSTTLSRFAQECISLRTKGAKKEGAREGNASDFFEVAKGCSSNRFLFIIYNKHTQFELASE
jgi:hypothetical protein